MFIEPNDIQLDLKRKKLAERCRNKSRYEINFVMNHHEQIACFIEGSNRFEGLFFITDINFQPFLIYKTKAYINSCAISDNGLYAIFQTAYNKENDDDSGVFTIIDIVKKVVLCKNK